MERLTPPIFDETDFGFGWFGAEQPKMQMASHALAADGGVWLVDPTDEPALDERALSLGPPRGVIQLLDRHNRGCAEVARRLGVPPQERRAASFGAAPLVEPLNPSVNDANLERPSRLVRPGLVSAAG